MVGGGTASKWHRGLGLIEVLLATVVVAVVGVALLGLAAREARWTRGVSDRTKAATLARNVLAVVAVAYRDHLLAAGEQQNDGTFLVPSPFSSIPGTRRALGTPLMNWYARNVRSRDLTVALHYHVVAPGASGEGQNWVSRVDCRVSWDEGAGARRCVECTRVISH